MTNDIQQLFDDAQDEGLSRNATTILVENLDGMVIAGAQGTAADDLNTDEVTLFVRVVDKTGSMGGNENAVITSCNEQVTALSGSKAADSILMSTWLFDEKPTLLHGYLPLPNVKKFDDTVYVTGGSTALYDAVLDAYSSVVAYGQQLRNQGIRTKIVIVIITDGEDNVSRASAAQVATVTTDLINQEIYTIALVSFGFDGKSIANKMGIPEKNVLNAGSSHSDIRHAMGTVSASVIRASQTMIDPNATGGFFS